VNEARPRKTLRRRRRLRRRRWGRRDFGGGGAVGRDPIAGKSVAFVEQSGFASGRRPGLVRRFPLTLRVAKSPEHSDREHAAAQAVRISVFVSPR